MTPRCDRWVLLFVFLLIVCGLVAVYSSTSVISPDMVAKSQNNGTELSQFGYLKRQLFTVLLGVIAMAVAFRVKLEHLRKAAVPLLLLSLVILALVFTPLGVSAGGAKRWIRLWPSTFQPSELVKLAMVIFLAWYISSPWFRKDSFRSFMIPIVVMGVFQGVFLLQPDFGSAMSLGLLALTMLFLSGIRLTYLLSLGLLAVPVIVILVSKPYRMKRITAFLDPWKDPLGSGFQLVQSYIALGSGGATGVGLGEGKQKLFFLPEIHTDFIFSLVGEELGFVGAVIIVVLFLMLFLRGISIAGKAPDPFSHNLATGISVMIALQAVINFAVVTGMVPTKGLPLPFVSYGGSSLLVNMIAVGLLLNVSRARRVPVPGGDFSQNRPSDQGILKGGSVSPDTGPAVTKWQRGYGCGRFGRRVSAARGAGPQGS